LRVLCAYFVLLLSGTQAWGEKLIFTEFDYLGRVSPQHYQLWFSIIDDAVGRLGYEFEVRFEPGRRAIHETLSDRSDGLLFQSPSLKKSYPKLVRVEYQLFRVPLYLYGLKEPKQRNFCNQKIGMLLGFDEFSQTLKTVFKCDSAIEPHYGNYFRQLLMMIQADRLDWVLAPIIMEPYLNTIVDQKMYRLQTSEIQHPVFMYLSAHNKKLAEPLAASLSDVYRERGIDNNNHTFLLSPDHLD
jgi:hypothetical protein